MGKAEKHPTQCQRLLAYIDKHGKISTMEAILELGIVNPSARISELKKGGWEIEMTMKNGLNRYKEPCRYAVYTIKTVDDTVYKAVDNGER